MGTKLVNQELTKSAALSSCGKYRYELWRVWDPTKLVVNFIMLNPSTADAEQDDPTIRRCMAYARSWGYGGIVVTNLYAYRATDPKVMLAAEDPVGPLNLETIRTVAEVAGMIICAWGNHGREQGACVRRDLEKTSTPLYYLRLNLGGTPRAPAHPLYLPGNLVPQRWL